MKFKTIAKALLMAGMFSLVAIEFTGCGAAHTAIKKRNLDVQTRMSETIFLEPAEPNRKIIFVDVRNTSDKEMNVKENIIASLQSRGYTVTQSPQQANYMLQVNVLQVGKTDLRGSQSALDGGFGGAVVGAGVGYASHNSNSNAAIGGLIGAAVGVVADAMVDDTYYSMITDVQIRERPLAGEVVKQTQAATLKQGSSTTVAQSIQGGNIEWKTYRTRVVSTANKVNLDFAEAQPVLEDALGRSLSGLF
ncbi:complement resistance protein TraT [Sulfuricurvum sp.]|uniref:complement resistance protein TraT n=1 Tax=Sulfuricurvum sp. TaxID=2025608 RepID=UPI003BAEC902